LSLIKSISGFRGTIGGRPGENLSPVDVVNSVAAFGRWVIANSEKRKVVIGRDARISGKMISNLTSATLQAMGLDVVDLGLSTTPTVEIAVPLEEAGGGIILTASHNPKEWNALKLLNEKGEFISGEEGREIIRLSEETDFEFASIDQLGKYQKDKGYLEKHVQLVLSLPIVATEKIRSGRFTVVVDAVNSSGALAVPALLKSLNCEVIVLNGEMTGDFAHNPEPLPEHLAELCKTVREKKADLGIAVDPDVDRLALVDENGNLLGEEYTLVAAADLVLSKQAGPTVSNLSSTRALRDLTEKYGQSYAASAVGEVNVVNLMKETGAVIGGEGNGGVIYPDLHYGRDALVGIAFFLSLMVEREKSASEIRAQYPDYTIRKNKINLSPQLDTEKLFEEVSRQYQAYPQNHIDGLKIDLPDGWIHLRKSNTEPIVRIYTEAANEAAADQLAADVKSIVNKFL
jgi:phosphomannomutase